MPSANMNDLEALSRLRAEQKIQITFFFCKGKCRVPEPSHIIRMIVVKKMMRHTVHRLFTADFKKFTEPVRNKQRQNMTLDLLENGKRNDVFFQNFCS